jgi:hypothetical protein
MYSYIYLGLVLVAARVGLKEIDYTSVAVKQGWDCLLPSLSPSTKTLQDIITMTIELPVHAHEGTPSTI